jgi:sugar phosphate isomerase/epimerase
MKLGINSSILGNLSLEGVIDFAASIGLKTIEAASWPVGKADRRYAGVTHINADTLTRDGAEKIKEYLAGKNIQIDSISYSPNPLVDDKEAREFCFGHIKKVIMAANMLGVRAIDTFIGKNPALPVSENMKLFKKYWPDIIRFAESLGVIVAFENCPMYFTMDEWPGGKNLAVSPQIWREMFSNIDSDSFGMVYDPSHLVWQRMNYIKPIYEFRDKIVNIHVKDAKFYQDKYDDVGFFAAPLEYHSPKLPGLGDIQWEKLVSALTDIGFTGSAFIEVEDRAFENSEEDKIDAVKISTKYMSQYIE